MKRHDFAAKFMANCLIIGYTEKQVTEYVQSAVAFGLKGVCVFQNMLKTALAASKYTGLYITTVTGYPSGIDVPETKIADIKLLAKNGAPMIEMGVNLSALLSRDFATLQKELREGVAAAHNGGSLLAAVLNVCKLNEDEARFLAVFCDNFGIDAIKLACGDSLLPRKTTSKDVKLIREVIKPETPILVDGLIDTFEDSLALLEAGADTVYSSKAFDILKECSE